MRVGLILSAKEQGPEVISIQPDVSVSEACKILQQHRIGAVLVRKANGDIAGILSERDIVRFLAGQGAEGLSAPAEKLMTANVITCSPDDTIDDVMGIMTQKRFRHVPVVDDGGIIGIISIGDVVKHKIEEIEAEAQQMRSYITSA